MSGGEGYSYETVPGHLTREAVQALVADARKRGCRVAFALGAGEDPGLVRELLLQSLDRRYPAWDGCYTATIHPDDPVVGVMAGEEPHALEALAAARRSGWPVVVGIVVIPQH